MAIKYIDDLNINGKKVLIRVDYNVPYDNGMNITDDTRIKATLPTINYCLDRGCSIILISHMGRPKGVVVPEMSLKPVAARLSEITGKKIDFIENGIGENTKDEIDKLGDGGIALLENIRFYSGEEKNDEDLGQKLASLADVFINDAFATAHRVHASNMAVTRYIDECGAGFLLKNEIEYFRKAMENPERPLGAVIGGAKVSSKLGVLKNIIDKVDFLIIGGGMAFTFLKARGLNTGKSILQKDMINTAGVIMDKAEKNGVELILPVDVVVAPEMSSDTATEVVDCEGINDDMMGLDIGPKSIQIFSEKIKCAKTIVWNGPMGAFEIEKFASGTFEIARVIAGTDCLSIVGGGDSVTALKKINIEDKISYISTGGGAFLELLEGKILPAISALDKY